MSDLRVTLLHGLAGSTRLWDHCRAQAPEDVRITAADIDWPFDGTAAPGLPGDPARTVAEVVRATRAQVVVAHSFAANALLEHLASPDASPLRGAVLVAPFYRPRRRDFDWDTISYYFNRFHQILEEGLHVTAAGRIDPTVRHAMALRVRETIGPYGWMDFFGAYLRTPALPLHRVRPPVLVVAGQDDRAAPPSDARNLARALPAARLDVFPSCGHFPMAERPRSFTRLLGDFLASLPAPSDRSAGAPPADAPLEMT
ncbi:alpha/beta fold hydrolase [Streptomyces sp. TRM S81-3]|uniref:Alpha/beta fold hydrolase n=1 Tax=Streptomyces griseicoloratus TaxID=2752516 RepID=A0A926L8B0_9ACTN|nr:alpha/beta fold hydrolase [Streptomyces griseicoloratus]MBD0423391.1 alpha/beta fold hydrolase [Streptomyces griseicoloratus]